MKLLCVSNELASILFLFSPLRLRVYCEQKNKIVFFFTDKLNFKSCKKNYGSTKTKKSFAILPTTTESIFSKKFSHCIYSTYKWFFFVILQRFRNVQLFSIGFPDFMPKILTIYVVFQGSAQRVHKPAT